MTGVRRSAEPVLDARAVLGECPVWDDDGSRLLWVDIERGQVHRLDPATGRDDVRAVGQPVGAVACRAASGLVLALRDGFGLLEAGASQVRLLAAVEAERRDHRMNDGACDAHGRFWAGTASTRPKGDTGTLYRLDGDGRVTPVIVGVGMSNGIGWSPDGRLMYYVDSAAGALDVLDFEPAAGSVSQRRRLVSIPSATGIPDGLAVDAAGAVWLAAWGSGRVLRYTPDGALDAEITVPVSQVTNCAFGGADLRDLYITSAAGGLDAGQRARQPHAGGIFVARPGVQGLPAARFAG